MSSDIDPSTSSALFVHAESVPAKTTGIWLRAFVYWWLKYKRTWRESLAYTVAYPTLYLAAMGAGLGTLIDRHLGVHGLSSGLGTTSYLAFIAPGVLAGSAMQVASNESTFPVIGAIRWDRTYFAQTATPIRVVDALYGHLFFMFIRIFSTCAIFGIVGACFSAFPSPEAVLAIPAGTLTGMCFATPIAAFAASQNSDSGFATLNRLIIVPLFLFSGAFFPIHQLPGYLQAIAQATPLYHGVALCRSCTLGELINVNNLGHLAYLVGLTVVGVYVARITYTRRLAP